MTYYIRIARIETIQKELSPGVMSLGIHQQVKYTTFVAETVSETLKQMIDFFPPEKSLSIKFLEVIHAMLTHDWSKRNIFHLSEFGYFECIFGSLIDSCKCEEIDSLLKKLTICLKNSQKPSKHQDDYEAGVCQGRIDELEDVINELEQILKK